MTGVVRLDLHVHSRHSPDSSLGLETIVDRLGIAGLRGFALTDHNSVAGHPAMSDLAHRNPMYLMVPGVEVSTREGHLLVYGVSEVPPVHRPLAETLDWVHARGVVAVLAHPLRLAHGVGRRVAETAPADGIETVNGHNGELANARAGVIATGRRLATTGGSDAHDAKGLGRAFTELPDEVDSVDAFLAALRRARCDARGESLHGLARVSLGVRTGLLRVARGLRPI